MFSSHLNISKESNGKPAKLTAKNLKIHDNAEVNKEEIQKEEQKVEPVAEEQAKNVNVDKEVKKIMERASTRQERRKPAWALSEKEAEELEEQDADNLLEFAYQLDYEKYIEDFEVRQALAVLKERVQELKQDTNWKEKFAAKWNKEQEAVKEPPVKELPEEKAETKSVRSQAKSIRSVADTIKDMEKKQKEEKPEWDKSVKSTEKISIEEKAARQIAEQVLENAPYLKGIHSKASMQKILEREAKVQLAQRVEPKIVTIKDGGRCRDVDPSNLPYLHRNEAI